MKGFQISHAIILPGYVLHVLQFFGHQYSFSLNWLFVFFLLHYQQSQTWWCHWWGGGRRGECRCCNQLYADEDFLIRKSERLLWQVAKWVTKDSVKCGLQLNTHKEVAAAVGKAKLQWAEEQERGKLSLQKWFSCRNTKDRSGGNMKTSKNIQPLQNWALHCCFLPNHRRSVLFQWKDDTCSLSVMPKHESHSEKEKPPVTAEVPSEPYGAQFRLGSHRSTKVVYLLL